jgi:hypothetical protein
MKYPRWIRIRQNLDTKRVVDPAAEVGTQLSALEGTFKIAKGARIAITAGSRYIANLSLITKVVVDFIRTKGAYPFLVPAMGSHGGATKDGQIGVLRELDLTEESIGAPIYSSMEVVTLGSVEDIPVYFDKTAVAADGIIVINRIKAHQAFRGDIQSGLNKMMAVGLGKKKGADAVHGSGRIDVLGSIGDFIISAVPILFGIAILENSYDETRDVAVLHPRQFKEYDMKWAQKSREILPRIPFRSLDLVIVDEMGKDISGSGMDTNVIGFTRRITPTGQQAVPLAVFDLTEKTAGNAMGIGLADFTTARLIEKIDYQMTYTNVIATGIYSAGRIPVTLDSEKAVIDTVLQKLDEPDEARIVRIKNTLQLEDFYATESLQGEAEENRNLQTENTRFDTSFNDRGDLMIAGTRGI